MSSLRFACDFSASKDFNNFKLIQNKLVVISGCSGGGKSTLLSELSKQGFCVVPEVGREIVREQLATNSHITPWENPQGFCEILIEKSVEAYHRALSLAEQKNKLVFFDRSFLEGISYFQTLNIHKYDHFIAELKYFHTVFMAAPWKEIFCQDDERKHSFHQSVIEYERLLEFYTKIGYSIVQIPKVDISARAQFIVSYFNEVSHD